MEQIYFGERIAALRRERGMTQESLAQRLGITNQAVSKWESDQCCPDIMQLPMLADLFGITLDELFGRSGKRQVSPQLPWENDTTLRAVCFLGHKLLEQQEINRESKELRKVQLNFEGSVQDVRSCFAVTCTNTTISGNVTAGDGVNCGDVGGDVKAGDGVKCGNVGGDVKAGDSVNCAEVLGSVSAGDSVTCGSVGGGVNAGDGVTCEAVEGSVKAGDSARCGNVGGNVSAGGDVTCGSVGGNVTAEGGVECSGKIGGAAQADEGIH